MTPMIHLLVFFFLSRLALLIIISSAEGEKHDDHQKHCQPFSCGKLGEIAFPFYNTTDYGCYGLYKLDCRDAENPKIELKDGGHWYDVENISQASTVTIKIDHHQLLGLMNSCDLTAIESFALPFPSPVSNLTSDNSMLTLFKCNHSVVGGALVPRHFQSTKQCGDYDVFFYDDDSNISSSLEGRQYCFRVPRSDTVTLEVRVNPKCYECHAKTGKCLAKYIEKHEFHCSHNNSSTPKVSDVSADKAAKWRLGLASGLGVPLGVLICLIVGFFVRRCYIRRCKAFLSRNVSDQNMNADQEAGFANYGVPLFSHKDLEEATDNFNTEKELGDGGFGTVYHGVLKDGRQVAVKRLYEHNYKRVEQFVNEVEILTRLRHRNLVTLYGCTSCRSRELLLVYEYISNGTVADHLHGDRAATSPLAWPVRLGVAVETATALAYLHASDTVHRDVKTNNILLDDNFCVKVADFGLSRLFPNDVTHVSTAPQGTPGYVDPEYHQCYQLTNKSDVYNFGVVLVELVSSLPAVDITRHRHEINLSNLAMSKIKKRAYRELVDPRLGFDSDDEAKRSIIAVAELAFKCLQQDKEMRPTMEEVLEELKRIEKGDNVAENRGSFDGVTTLPPPSPECDEAYLLKSKKEEPLSPNAVTESWPSSRSITPNISA